MKTKNLIALFVATTLIGCDKPTPTNETTKEPIYHNLTVKTYSSVMEETFGICRIVADVYLYPLNASISFDTMGASKTSTNDFLLFNTTPMQFLEAFASDTTSHLQAPKGNHQLLICYPCWLPNEEVEGYIIKRRKINIVFDTLVYDTLSESDFYKYRNN